MEASKPQRAGDSAIGRWVMRRPAFFLWLARIAFWFALAYTLANALLPSPDTPELFPWDKAFHFTAFYGLTGLAAAAFPRRNLVLIGVCLSGMGALIEVVQGTPLIDRDADFWDWVADTVAIVCVLLPVLLVPWRASLRGARRSPE